MDDELYSDELYDDMMESYAQGFVPCSWGWRTEKTIRWIL